MLDVYVLFQLEAVYSGEVRMGINDIMEALQKSKHTILDAIKGLVDIKFIKYTPAKNQFELSLFTINKFQLAGAENSPAKTLKSKNGSAEIKPPKENAGAGAGAGAGVKTTLTTAPATSEEPHKIKGSEASKKLRSK